MRLVLLALALVLPALGASEADLRKLLLPRPAGAVQLPAGVIEITREIALPKGLRDIRIEGHPQGTTLRLADNFQGRAALVITGANGIALSNFAVDGNRLALEKPTELSAVEKPFSEQYPNNGVIVEGSQRVTLDRLRFHGIANYAVIVTASSGVTIDQAVVRNSGSRNARLRNNASGGILLEEGTADFTVSRSTFRNIRGNAVWTHSWARSPRNRDGAIRGNQFDTVARDAVQVGHALRVRVEDNRGQRIGYPTLDVDTETGATPVGIDTSGNVEASVYTRNVFEELNGKCIDLDGFHHGEVTHNQCTNRGRPEDYPAGHFGIVVNNWNPAMESEGIVIADNRIDGSKFGGLFLIGRNHRVERNRFLNLNLARCNESRDRFGCVAIAGEPDVLQAGIYLGRIAAEWAQKRADPSRGHVIQNNTVSGYRMAERCIRAAPGVDPAASRIGNNTCQDTAK